MTEKYQPIELSDNCIVERHVHVHRWDEDGDDGNVYGEVAVQGNGNHDGQGDECNKQREYASFHIR